MGNALMVAATLMVVALPFATFLILILMIAGLA